MNQLCVAATEKAAKPESYDQFEARLIRALGATVGAGALSRALGYRSQAAFRQAHARGRLPVLTYELEGRRGRYATTTDIATWLWKQGLMSQEVAT